MSVDVVCCWVRLDDQYAEAMQQYRSHATNSQAFAKGRYRDNGELVHSMRAIMKYMPWVQTIHIVTNGQTPPKEVMDIGKVRLHTHADVFADPSHLPTFNYHAIEANLSRLPGLSEQFIITADDFFVGKPLSPDDFLGPTGQPRVWFVPRVFPTREEAKSLWDRNQASSNDALTRVYGPAKRYPFTHTPVMMLRSVCDEVQRIWQPELTATSSHKFRHERDVIFRILYMYHVIHAKMGLTDIGGDTARASGVCALWSGDYRMALVGDQKQDWRKALDGIVSTQPRFYCLNDHIGDSDEHAAEVQARLFEFYRQMGLED